MFKINRTIQILNDTGYFSGGKCCIITGFNKTGMCNIHFLSKNNIKLPVYFINTEYHFKETIKFALHVKEKYSLDLRIVSNPVLTDDAFPDKNKNVCCAMRKLIPYLRIANKYKFIVSGLRRDQSKSRKDLSLVESDSLGITKINLFYNYTRDNINELIKKNNISINPLLKNGYGTTGCEPCTYKSFDREINRWPGTDKTECLLHTKILEEM